MRRQSNASQNLTIRKKGGFSSTLLQIVRKYFILQLNLSSLSLHLKDMKLKKIRSNKQRKTVKSEGQEVPIVEVVLNEAQ